MLRPSRPRETSVRLLTSRRPSPAFLLALLALLVATGAPAEAARLITGNDIRSNSVPGNRITTHTLTGGQIKRGSITGYHIHDRSLTPADFRGSVRGPAGPAGPAGTAKAYANVAADGTVSSVDAKGIGRVLHPTAGLYCFYLDFRPANVQATLDTYRSSGVQLIKATTRPDDRQGNACPGSESASVRTFKLTAKNIPPRDAEIWVEFN